MESIEKDTEKLFAVYVSLDKKSTVQLSLTEIQNLIAELVPLITSREPVTGTAAEKAAEFFGKNWKIGNEMIALQIHLRETERDSDYLSSLFIALANYDGERLANLLSVCLIRLTIQNALSLTDQNDKGN